MGAEQPPLAMGEVPRHIEIVLGYDRAFRSQIIYEAIALESLLDGIIAWHFCSDATKHPLLFTLIFKEGEISFGKKIRMLSKLLKQCYPDLKPTFGALPKRLNALRELRNRFAHSEVVLPDEPPPPDSAAGVTLRYFRDGALVDEFIQKTRIDAIVADCMYLHVMALALQTMIKGRATGERREDQEQGLMAVAEVLKKRLVNKTPA